MKASEKITGKDHVTFEDLGFGVEIETAGVARDRIEASIVSHLSEFTGTRWVTIGTFVGFYQATEITDHKGRIWRLVNDASIAYVNNQRGTEIVTPVLNYREDIQVLMEVVRAVRASGAKPDKSCGIHVHCGSEHHTPESIGRLMTLWYRNEEIFFDMAGTSEARKNSYTRPMPTSKINHLGRVKPSSQDGLAQVWFNGGVTTYLFDANGEVAHYNPERYHALNLNNLWRGSKTVECRAFNASLHATKIAAWVTLWLAINARAMNMSQSPARKARMTDPVHNCPILLLNLGIKGDRFKSIRKFLMAPIIAKFGRRTATATAA